MGTIEKKNVKGKEYYCVIVRPKLKGAVPHSLKKDPEAFVEGAPTGQIKQVCYPANRGENYAIDRIPKILEKDEEGCKLCKVGGHKENPPYDFVEQTKRKMEIPGMDEWEGEVVRYLEEIAEVDTSDAQGIMEAQEMQHPDILIDAFKAGKTPRQAAKMIEQKSRVNPRTPPSSMPKVPPYSVIHMKQERGISGWLCPNADTIDEAMKCVNTRPVMIPTGKYAVYEMKGNFVLLSKEDEPLKQTSKPKAVHFYLVKKDHLAYFYSVDMFKPYIVGTNTGINPKKKDNEWQQVTGLEVIPRRKKVRQITPYMFQVTESKKEIRPVLGKPVPVRVTDGSVLVNDTWVRSFPIEKDLLDFAHDVEKAGYTWYSFFDDVDKVWTIHYKERPAVKKTIMAMA